jgi:ankyrin repeat protein
MQTALDLAVEGYHAETANYLNDHITTKRATLNSSLWNLSDLVHRQLYEATVKQDIDEVVELSARAADPCWSNPRKGEGGKCAIHVASELGHVELLSLLMSKQGKNRATVRDSFGETALHKAAAEGKLDVCKFLIVDMGVNPNLRNATMQTALDLSIENEQPLVQEYLTAFTAKPKK